MIFCLKVIYSTISLLVYLQIEATEILLIKVEKINEKLNEYKLPIGFLLLAW